MREQTPPFMCLLSNAEQEQLLVEWNTTRVEYPHDQCVQTLFERSVEQHPESIALVQADTQLSYGELDRRANQLAHYLQRQGIGPEIRVGVCLQRSLDLVIACLAVLKAGGCYLPMDVLLPRDRLLFQLHDAQVPLVITHTYLVDALRTCQAELLCLHHDSLLFQQEATTAPQTSGDPENLVYIIYTSGSTG